MTFDDALNHVGALLTAVGGGSVILLGLSTWLGQLWASKILESDRRKHEKELEELKSRFTADTEILRTKLSLSFEISKRFAERQFHLYNELWISLVDLRIAGDNLWEKLDLQSLKNFAKQLDKTEEQILRSSLIIEDQHYEALRDLIDRFSDFEVGKNKLMNFRKNNSRANNEITAPMINDCITNNGDIKQRYSHLLTEIEKSFKKQIRNGFLNED